MSHTACYYPIVGALLGALDYLKAKDFHAVNPIQQEFLDVTYGDACVEAKDLKDMETRASAVAAELNSFLKERGFDIKLNDFKEGEFGVASILDVLVEWIKEGQRRKIAFEGAAYDGVYLDDNFSVFKADGHEHPIARVDTKKDGEYVFLTKSSSMAELDIMAIMPAVKDLESKLVIDNTSYEGLHFPMVDLNHMVNLDWLLKMFTMRAWLNGRSRRRCSKLNSV